MAIKVNTVPLKKEGLKAVFKNNRRRLCRLGHPRKVFSPEAKPLAFKKNPLLSGPPRLL
jgi:hypothetical protein